MTKHATEAQIVKILEEFRTGAKADELCRTHGISRATLYKWRDKYGDMPLSDIKRMQELEQENQKLKAMYAELK